MILDKNPKDSWAFSWLLNYFYIQKNKTVVQMNTRVTQQGADAENSLAFFFLPPQIVILQSWQLHKVF